MKVYSPDFFFFFFFKICANLKELSVFLFHKGQSCYGHYYIEHLFADKVITGWTVALVEVNLVF